MKQYTPLIVAALGLIVMFAPVDGCEGVLPTPFDAVVDPAKTEGAWVVVVEQTSERTPETVKLLSNPIWTGLSDRGLKWRVYDADSENGKRYASHAESLPWVLVMDAGGVKLASKPLPKDATELDALVKEVTGR